MFIHKDVVPGLKALAFLLGFIAIPLNAKTYDWPLPENGTLTVNIARGALLIVTRDDGKPQVSLDMQKVNIAREASLTTRKITGDISSDEPQWSPDGQNATLTLPAPADIDLQKVKGVTAALSLPATGQYEINGTLTDIYLKGTKNNIRVNVVDGKVNAQNALSGSVSLDVMKGEILTEAMKVPVSVKLRSGNLTDKNSEGPLTLDLVKGDLTLNSLSETIHIRQTTGTQNIHALACETFSNNLQTGNGKIHFGTVLAKGDIFSADGEIITVIPASWQGKIIAEGITGNNIINQLSAQKPVAIKAPLSDEYLEIAHGKVPDKSIMTLKTVGGVFTLQPEGQGSK
ncbi:hypothetical protein [Citrobacter rodentium]|uniref:Exported protein n=1 Tax=Citrobacter rodentium (strain ICC168) TaxID=637910 RepID=D2TU69_CITRI|nr:hypothetical protein [Citrobacter rodentium]KIQ52653.1 hypothetical protein TA05_03545 [Citrobacter rodentium]UHO32458.1 hypothetical protein K7R23_07270 [Citrobacter rodentium NBRC 105723 = DSM 16636]CBG90535.1 putative exported protein [Citrobacter rodentium ICC168]